MQVNNDKTMLALNEASTEVTAFVQSLVAEVEAIEAEYSAIVPQAETKQDYNFCKEVRKNVLPIKTAMESARKTLKAPVIEMGKLIDSSLNPLTARLDAVYKPFEDAYREVDNRKRIAEEKRQATIQAAFDKLNDSALEAIGQNSTVIEVIISDIQDYDFDPDVFQERTDEAVRKQADLLDKLQQMLKAAITQEETDAKLAKLAEMEEAQRRAEQEELQRKRDEEIRIQAQKEVEERHAIEMQQAKQREEMARIAAEEAAKQAELDKLAAIEKAKADAIAEQKRIADEQAEQQRKLEANKKHVSMIRGQATDSLVEQGLSEEQAKDIVIAISKGLIANVSINY